MSNKLKIITTLLVIWFPTLINAQECKGFLNNYYNSLDTTERKVYLIVDEMPSFFDDNQNILKVFSDCIDFKEIKCCTNFIWYAFVIENNGAITNIQVCPTFWDCENEIDIEISKKSVIERYTKVISEIKTTSGKLNNNPVAIAHISRVHYECMN